ncbi:MAG: L,D-transpeptidase [Opitutales bacterium]|nr:L,D-transpeptidase [Opitutales bacterium]
MTWDIWRGNSLFSRALRESACEPTEHVLAARLSEKKLVYYLWRKPIAEFALSSGRNPPSNAEGSEGTPPGLHRIAEKFGDGAPPGTVFVGRRSQGHTFRERHDAGPEQKCLVTTRILRLAGLQPGINAGPGVDSYARYIYIHGTNRPDAWTENVSAGCLLLRDPDVIRLHDSVPLGSLVWIEV